MLANPKGDLSPLMMMALVQLGTLTFSRRFRSHAGSSMQCMRPDGTWAPCVPGNDQCGPALQGGPQFHLTDRS